MKFIHCADIHLGSKIDSRFPKEVSEERKAEVRASFSRMVAYARENGVRAVLLSGDVFDSDRPFKKDKEFFFSVVENNPQIDFLYLRGNHDLHGETEKPENLKTFGGEWTAYEYGDITVSGVELASENATSIYSTLTLDPNKKNVVMMHGQISESTGKDNIRLSLLREKNVDYLALGHVHTFDEGKLDERGRYAYSGCLEGRGFDETGEKGFVLLEIDEAVSYRFTPFSKRNILKREVDITGLAGAYEAALKIRESGLEKDHIYRVELVGEVDAYTESLAYDVESLLKGACAYLSVKDCTKKRIDVHAYENDLSLKGEFVRAVYQSEEYSDEEKMQIIAYGLKALGGEEVDA